MSANKDGMGPRIDLEPDSPESEFSHSAPPNPYQPPRRQAPGLATILSGSSLLVALLAGGLSIAAFNSEPHAVQGPMPPAEVVPGGAAVRVAQLEKDVQSLMLRIVTLEKELTAVAGKTGGVTKITELTAKVAALQSRLDGMGAGIPRSAAAAPPAGDDERPAPKAPPKPPARSEAPARPEAAARPEAPKPAPKPAAKAESEAARKMKHVYNVRRGDTLFSVARRHNVTPEDLSRWNNLQPGAHLLVDQQLVIYK